MAQRSASSTWLLLYRVTAWSIVHPMGPQSTFPAPILFSVAVSRRELAELVADSALEEQLLGITVQLRSSVPYSDLLVLVRLSAAVHDCTPPANEHVLKQWAVVYARDNLFEISNLQPLIERVGAIKALKAAWLPTYKAIRQQWPELSNECPTIPLSEWRLPFRASVIQERKRLYKLVEGLSP